MGKCVCVLALALASAAAPACTTRANVSFPGDNLQLHPNVTDPAACCALCLAAGEPCRGWVVNLGQQSCNLKTKLKASDPKNASRSIEYW